MAAFENKTISEIRDFLVNSIKVKFNATFRILPKSFISVISTVFAGVFVVLYKNRSAGFSYSFFPKPHIGGK
jgi:hypothetical protein